MRSEFLLAISHASESADMRAAAYPSGPEFKVLAGRPCLGPGHSSVSVHVFVSVCVPVPLLERAGRAICFNELTRHS